jgi:hypothetical protein
MCGANEKTMGNDEMNFDEWLKNFETSPQPLCTKMEENYIPMDNMLQHGVGGTTVTEEFVGSPQYPLSTGSASPTLVRSPIGKPEKHLNLTTEETGAARKRQKQNQAAQRCRQKKLDKLHEFESQVKLLEEEKFNLSVRIAVLEQEKKDWAERESKMEMKMKSLQGIIDDHQFYLMGRHK